MKTLRLKEIIGHMETTMLSITSCPKFFSLEDAPSDITLVQKKRKEDARPGAHGGRSSRKLRGRSPARIGRSSREDVQRDTQWTLVQPGRSGRSSSQAEDARSARQKRTLVQRDKRTLVQDLGRSSRPEKRTLVHIQFIQMIRAGRNGAPGATFCERLAPGRETERAPGATFREFSTFCESLAPGRD
ncbi:hypothetical protein LR48_Vigan10g285900 [Vigna angularis]|uniref:Uncharacterized protein n=1 Tax=Phaseolus angularis TaxID=3914 RepID=A0A0L9VQ16_PHAAN|nr:hypothetical protein LR48_Vigan10g285900 [Vigna angularis]